MASPPTQMRKQDWHTLTPSCGQSCRQRNMRALPVHPEFRLTQPGWVHNWICALFTWRYRHIMRFIATDWSSHRDVRSTCSLVLLEVSELYIHFAILCYLRICEDLSKDIISWPINALQLGSTILHIGNYCDFRVHCTCIIIHMYIICIICLYHAMLGWNGSPLLSL